MKFLIIIFIINFAIIIRANDSESTAANNKQNIDDGLGQHLESIISDILDALVPNQPQNESVAQLKEEYRQTTPNSSTDVTTSNEDIRNTITNNEKPFLNRHKRNLRPIIEKEPPVIEKRLKKRQPVVLEEQRPVIDEARQEIIEEQQQEKCNPNTQIELEIAKHRLHDMQKEIEKLNGVVRNLREQQSSLKLTYDNIENFSESDVPGMHRLPKRLNISEFENVTVPYKQILWNATKEDIEDIKMQLHDAYEVWNTTKQNVATGTTRVKNLEKELGNHKEELQFIKTLLRNFMANNSFEQSGIKKPQTSEVVGAVVQNEKMLVQESRRSHEDRDEALHLILNALKNQGTKRKGKGFRGSFRQLLEEAEDVDDTNAAKNNVLNLFMSDESKLDDLDEDEKGNLLLHLLAAWKDRNSQPQTSQTNSELKAIKSALEVMLKDKMKVAVPATLDGENEFRGMMKDLLDKHTQTIEESSDSTVNAHNGKAKPAFFDRVFATSFPVDGSPYSAFFQGSHKSLSTPETMPYPFMFPPMYPFLFPPNNYPYPYSSFKYSPVPPSQYPVPAPYYGASNIPNQQYLKSQTDYSTNKLNENSFNPNMKVFIPTNFKEYNSPVPNPNIIKNNMDNNNGIYNHADLQNKGNSVQDTFPMSSHSFINTDSNGQMVKTNNGYDLANLPGPISDQLWYEQDHGKKYQSMYGALNDLGHKDERKMENFNGFDVNANQAPPQNNLNPGTNYASAKIQTPQQAQVSPNFSAPSKLRTPRQVDSSMQDGSNMEKAQHNSNNADVQSLRNVIGYLEKELGSI